MCSLQNIVTRNIQKMSENRNPSLKLTFDTPLNSVIFQVIKGAPQKLSVTYKFYRPPYNGHVQESHICSSAALGRALYTLANLSCPVEKLWTSKIQNHLLYILGAAALQATVNVTWYSFLVLKLAFDFPNGGVGKHRLFSDISAWSPQNFHP